MFRMMIIMHAMHHESKRIVDHDPLRLILSHQQVTIRFHFKRLDLALEVIDAFDRMGKRVIGVQAAALGQVKRGAVITPGKAVHFIFTNGAAPKWLCLLWC